MRPTRIGHIQGEHSTDVNECVSLRALFVTRCHHLPLVVASLYFRKFIKDLERIRPESIVALIKSGESIVVKSEVALPTSINCNRSVHENIPDWKLSHEDLARKNLVTISSRCGYISSQSICKACLLLEGLNTGCTDIGVKKVGSSSVVVIDSVRS